VNHAVKAPAAVLDELGVGAPSDIMIEGIAEYCGATIVYEPLDGCEARILGSGDRAIITVNANSPRPRQRFSAGHELGHWMRDRGKLAFSCTDNNLVRDWGDDSPERRANRYAADLLLPRRLFEEAARGLPPTFESVRRLAVTFETSLTATAIRLAELGDAPAMIVCNDMQGRRWFYRTSLVPLWPLSKPGPNSEAARLLAGGFTRSGGPATVDADEWIDHAGASKYTLIEDSTRAGNVVLSLLWWKDERQILDLDDDDQADPEGPLSGHLSFGARSSRRGRQ
jgi:hypothetical protein